MPPPAPAQRDLLVGSGCSNLQAAVPHPPGPSPGLLLVPPRGHSGARARRAVPRHGRRPQTHAPPSCCCRSAWPPPSPQTRTPHSKCQPSRGLGPSVKRAGEEHCHREPRLAPGPAPLKGGRGQDGLASPRSHFLLLSKQGGASSSCLSPGPCCSCPGLSLMLHLPPKTRTRSSNCPPTLESCPFNICLVPVTSSFSIHSGEMKEAVEQRTHYFTI